jgi:uncharacterized protein (TIGR03435 family)
MIRRPICLFSLAIVSGGMLPAGQSDTTAKTPLAFEVASVKATDPGKPPNGLIRPLPSGQGYIAEGATVRSMITMLYKITNSQLTGEPAWINTAPFDVQAKAEKPANRDDLHEMFQTLLADRFKLKFHREMRTITALALVVDKPGKLKVNDSVESFDVPMRPTAPFRWTGDRVPMSYLTWFVSQRLDRPVIDKTGLTGFYDFTFDFLPELPPGATINGQPLPDFPNIYQALKDQLGLKLESQKGQVEFFVIDHVEKPTEN